MQSLKGITIDAAWALGLEDEIGSIAVGKRADFVVLDADPLELGIDGLLELKVMATVFEGRKHMNLIPGQSSLLNSLLNPEEAEQARDKLPGQWRVASSACNGISDRCDLVRTWSQWLSSTLDSMRDIRMWPAPQ